ncbi:hypothetical protein C8R47DRAFT_813524 [Mycena vitilis]|nr:hypothetical protein C8R47DRAFT_813524 [Mycena vitilis]
MDSYNDNVNTNSVYGTDGTRGAATEAGYTGSGQTDRFDNSNTSGGYGQQNRFDNSGSAGANAGGNVTGAGITSGMSDMSTARTDDLSSTTGGYGGQNFDTDRDNFGTGNRDEFGAETHGKPSMGDKLKGGAEKLAGKVTGNAGMQERGQERKMGDNERTDF